MGTLFRNGTIYTLVEEESNCSAVYVDNGKIMKTGTEHELTEQFGESITDSVDLEGGVMFPGFVDSHLHLIGHGEKLIRLDLSEMTSAEEMESALKEKAKTLKKEEWLLGEGWNENNFIDRKIFHKLELDRIAEGRPVLLSRVCRHAFLASSKALELADITKETPDPPGGIIKRDAEGEPTGLLHDSAADIVKKVVPEVSQEYLNRALETSVKNLLSLGLTGGHSEDLSYYGGVERPLKAFKNVLGHKNKFKAHLLVHHEALDDFLKIEQQYQMPFVEYGAMKIFADGAFGGRTAWVSLPYNDAPETSGVSIHEDDDLLNLVEKARSHNRNIAVHTIGDMALIQVLKIIKKSPAKSGRDRIIHAGLVSEEIIKDLKELPVILDIQPGFIGSDFPWLIERLGTERIPYAYAFRTLLDESIICAGGSDAPIEPVDPLLGIYAAVARRKPDESHEGYVPEQKITRYEAIGLYTFGSAAAIGQENVRGYIKEGYTADFTVFDRDLFKVPIDEIIEANVLYTIVNGEIAFQQTNNSLTQKS
ncbi:amidohydrolase [Bacillus sp. NEB1478]|uniref:amidohydrolase n=1 Tax=Bacillus sp. NEB1478 TaxID=3073816 RepID=UPI00287364B6|nr:amidohydrolase [Bacillus sp. NEB1478]WNB93140.1 amidohydrolase [Bacillus sp. NEB1478]